MLNVLVVKYSSVQITGVISNFFDGGVEIR